jgi:hypothetical protein
MARAHYFRRNAETCSINAQLASELPERARWRVRAQRWLQLANEAETKADNEPLTPDVAFSPARAEGTGQGSGPSL